MGIILLCQVPRLLRLMRPSLLLLKLVFCDSLTCIHKGLLYPGGLCEDVTRP